MEWNGMIRDDIILYIIQSLSHCFSRERHKNLVIKSNIILINLSKRKH